MRLERTTTELHDAVLMLGAPRREAPGLTDTSRAACSYGLLLAIPIGLIAGAFFLLARLAPALPAFPVW
jgi:hypothetical protein